MSQYYFLISGLSDLILDGAKKPFTTADFLELCEDQMTESDFNELKKVYIFRDIKNVINHKKNDTYVSPSCYTETEFQENLKDPDTFFPFIAEYFFYLKNEKNQYPEMTELDGLLQLFYDNLSDFGCEFIRDYFDFELNLRNITTALSMKKSGQNYTNYIIKSGDFFENLLKNTNVDFGLSNEFPYIEKLIEIYDTGEQLKIEKTIEDIRWLYLDEYIEREHFSRNVVFCYAVKLLSVERWFEMTPERGREMFEKLIEQIKGNIKFSDEFIVVGGKK